MVVVFVVLPRLCCPSSQYFQQVVHLHPAKLSGDVQLPLLWDDQQVPVSVVHRTIRHAEETNFNFELMSHFTQNAEKAPRVTGKDVDRDAMSCPRGTSSRNRAKSFHKINL